MSDAPKASAKSGGPSEGSDRRPTRFEPTNTQVQPHCRHGAATACECGHPRIAHTASLGCCEACDCEKAPDGKTAALFQEPPPAPMFCGKAAPFGHFKGWRCWLRPDHVGEHEAGVTTDDGRTTGTLRWWRGGGR